MVEKNWSSYNLCTTGTRVHPLWYSQLMQFYCFWVVDVGAYGRSIDRGTVASSNSVHALNDGSFDLSCQTPPPKVERHVFVTVVTFPQWCNLLWQFP